MMNVKLKLTHARNAVGSWVHVEWFKIRGCKPRQYIDNFYLTWSGNATWVPSDFVEDLVAKVRDLANFYGYERPRVECYVMVNRKMTRISQKAAIRG